MTKRKSSTITTACLLAVVAMCAGFYAVKPLPGVVDADTDWREVGSEIEHPFGEKLVKGAPFSAQVIIESTQTLANGVHVSSKMTGALYRDGEGRTRQELPRDGSPEIVMVNDPVAGVLYHLHMFQHTVLKINYTDAHRNSDLEARAHNREMEERRNREIEEREKHGRQLEEAARKVNIERGARTLEPEKRIESLGIQTLEGVQAEVKRVTITIPAGREGNDQPFEIVSEKWYSPDLQVLIMSKHSDPRIGDTIYRLANINRSEPARTLFDAPSDFTVTEEKTEFRRKERQ
ncbi:MAG: hypothetical protein DMF60_09715 [Acidobacteria bacterium]|nr:MAG: hypothetical protein DMF60_09715 [Acidobacteriota bacterium]